MLNECKLTTFGLAVKTELLKLGKPQKWLEEQVAERTGLYMDNGYMYKLLTGKNKSQKIVDAICDILGLEEAGG